MAQPDNLGLTPASLGSDRGAGPGVAGRTAYAERMGLRRRYFRTRPSASVIALLALGLVLLLGGFLVSGSAAHVEHVGSTRVLVHHLQTVDYAKLAAKVVGIVLVLTAAVRHANQLETDEDRTLAAATSPAEGDLADLRASVNANAHNLTQRRG
jgi:hypothetical protein